MTLNSTSSDGPLAGTLRLHFDRFPGFVEEYRSLLSLGGMFLKTQDLHPVGSQVGFDLRLSDGFRLVQGSGEVVWVRPEGGGPGQEQGLALRFRALDEKGRELVLKILEEQVKGGGSPFDVDEIPPGVISTPGEPAASLSATPTAAAPAAAAPVAAAPSEAEALEFSTPWEKLPEVPMDVLEEPASGAQTELPLTAPSAFDLQPARSPAELATDVLGDALVADVEAGSAAAGAIETPAPAAPAPATPAVQFEEVDFGADPLDDDEEPTFVGSVTLPDVGDLGVEEPETPSFGGGAFDTGAFDGGTFGGGAFETGPVAEGLIEQARGDSSLETGAYDGAGLAAIAGATAGAAAAGVAGALDPATASAPPPSEASFFDVADAGSTNSAAEPAAGSEMLADPPGMPDFGEPETGSSVIDIRQPTRERAPVDPVPTADEPADPGFGGVTPELAGATIPFAGADSVGTEGLPLGGAQPAEPAGLGFDPAQATPPAVEPFGTPEPLGTPSFGEVPESPGVGMAPEASVPFGAPEPVAPAALDAPVAPAVEAQTPPRTTGGLFDPPATPGAPSFGNFGGEPAETPVQPQFGGSFGGGESTENLEPGSAPLAPTMEPFDPDAEPSGESTLSLDSPSPDPYGFADYEDDLDGPPKKSRGPIVRLALLGLVVLLAAAGYFFKDTLMDLVGLGGDPAPVVTAQGTGGPPPAAQTPASGGAQETGAGDTLDGTSGSADNSLAAGAATGDPQASDLDATDLGTTDLDAADLDAAGSTDSTDAASQDFGADPEPYEPADTVAEGGREEPDFLRPPPSTDTAGTPPAQEPAASPPPTRAATAAPPPVAPVSATRRGGGGQVIESITWSEGLRGTEVAVRLDGAVAPDRVSHDLLDYKDTVEQVRIQGIVADYFPATVDVGTAGLDRVRVGLHAAGGASEIRIVFDFPRAGPSIREVRVEGNQVLVQIR